MDIKLRIEQIKKQETDMMNKYDEQIREHYDLYGHRPCDYVNYRREMSLYHRGRVNLCIDLIRELEGLK